MRKFFFAAPVFFVGACNSAPPPTNAVDVTANNMIADDVTEVQDETVTSAPAQPENRAGSGSGKNEQSAQ